MTATIRLAGDSDVAPMLAIYAPVVRDTAISFEQEPPTEEEFRRRLRFVLAQTPWLVCETDGTVAGYAYAGTFRPRVAYQWTVEVTVYVHPEYHGWGVGRALYTSLFACLRLLGYTSAVAVIALPNPASVALHERVGFEPVGVYRSLGYKHGRWHDVGWWQLALCPPEPSPEPPRPLRRLANTPEWKAALQSGASLVRI